MKPDICTTLEPTDVILHQLAFVDSTKAMADSTYVDAL